MNANQLITFFQRALLPLKTRVQLMIGKCIIAAVDDSTLIQELQISALKGEAMGKVPRVQEFGFASNPPKGSEAIVVALGGNRENLVVIATDKRQVRFKNLESGATAIYTDDGTVIHLKKGGLVDVIAATKVLVTCPDVEFTGNVKILGNLHVVQTAQVDLTLNATVGVGAGYYSGPLGGPAMPVLIPVPVIADQTIVATGDITGANVLGGGTDLASVKSVFNAHTHPENDNAPAPTLVTTTPL